MKQEDVTFTSAPLANHSWTQGLSGCDWCSQWHPSGENWFPLCQQVTVINSFLVRSGIPCQSSSSQCWNPVWLEPLWVSLGLTTSLCELGCASVLLCLQDTASLCHPFPLTLKSFSFLFPMDLWAFQRRGLIETFLLGQCAPKSLIQHCPVVGLFISIYCWKNLLSCRLVGV